MWPAWRLYSSQLYNRISARDSGCIPNEGCLSNGPAEAKHSATPSSTRGCAGVSCSRSSGRRPEDLIYWAESPWVIVIAVSGPRENNDERGAALCAVRRARGIAWPSLTYALEGRHTHAYSSQGRGD